MLAESKHQKWAEGEENGWQCERKPKPDVFLRVHCIGGELLDNVQFIDKQLTHGNLTDKCSNVDQKVVAHVDSGVGDPWIDDDSFSVWFGANESSRVAGLILLRNQWRYAALEETPIFDEVSMCLISARSSETYTPVPNKINPRMNEPRAPSGFGPMT